MAKIATDVDRALAERARNGGPGGLLPRRLAHGSGWIVEDMVCTCGPHDRPFDEQHSAVSIGLVVAGTFEYTAASHGTRRSELMTPGSLLLGNPGHCFRCEHTHAAGDRCISFRYDADYFARIAEDLGARSESPFDVLRVPPLRTLSPLVALSCAGLAGAMPVSWEELGVRMAGHAIEAAGVPRRSHHSRPEAVARVTDVIRRIERQPHATLTLGALARWGGLSPYHLLRTFERVTGVTPHQYVLRTRLRQAAVRLAIDPSRILDVALDCGFGDVSNFNRAFRAEFGVSPRVFRGLSRTQAAARVIGSD